MPSARVEIKRETEKAIGVEDVNGSLLWIPKSQVSIEDQRDGTSRISMSRWLASEYEAWLVFDE